MLAYHSAVFAVGSESRAEKDNADGRAMLLHVCRSIRSVGDEVECVLPEGLADWIYTEA